MIMENNIERYLYILVLLVFGAILSSCGTEVDDSIHSSTSEDGKMTFRSWNKGVGGSNPTYGVTCEYLTTDGKKITEDFSAREGDPAWVHRVHSIRKKDGSTYYITKRSYRVASDEIFMWMEAFMIDHDTLRSVSVFDGGDDLDECGLEIHFHVSDSKETELDRLFEYDVISRNLYVPGTSYAGDEASPVLNNRYRVYHFDGTGFVYKREIERL